MRKWILLCCPLVLGVSSQGQLSVGDLGNPFQAKGIPITWEAETNIFPDSVAVYEVVPAHVSRRFVSNIVALAKFAEPDKALTQLLPASEGKEAFYSDVVDKKYIGLSPSRGRAYYRSERAICLPKQSVEGVPDDEKAREIALTLLPELLISTNQLAYKPGTRDVYVVRSARVRTSFDKRAGKAVKETIARGVSMFRATNGISFAGRGVFDGVYVNFGSKQEVAELELVWRNLQFYRLLPVADSRRILERIRTGKAVIQMEAGLDQIRSLIVRKAQVYYLGKDGLEIQKMVYPFVALNATADMGNTNVNVVINCPLVQ
jgi:hypothetical protein